MSVDTAFDAAVLAGGGSTRMGRDKALLAIDGRTLLARQVELVRALGPAHVWVSGRRQEEVGALDALGLPDEAPGQGPLGGVATVLRATRAPHVLVVAVDMPALDVELLRRLLGRRSEGVGVVPRLGDRWEPAAAIYPRELAEPARAALGSGVRSLHALVEAAVTAGRLVAEEIAAGDERCFANWNTPADVPQP